MGESCASKIVLKTNDVVLAKIVTALHFDKDQVVSARVFNAMSSADGNIDRFSIANCNLAAVESYLCGTGNDEPVFRPLRVFLVTQTFSGKHLDPFDLESRCFFQHGVGAPWPLIKFSHWLIPRAPFKHKKAAHGLLRSASGIASCY
jgi:hypothetical protein